MQHTNIREIRAQELRVACCSISVGKAQVTEQDLCATLLTCLWALLSALSHCEGCCLFLSVGWLQDRTPAPFLPVPPL